MAKEHLKSDPEDWLFKRQRKGRTHIDACELGYMRKKFSQVHHALCVHACSDTTFPEEASDDEIEFIRLCLAPTDWDINAEPNVIGLPLKSAYVKFPNDSSWDGYPCHQVDHDTYLDDVEDYVTGQIWTKVTSSKKKKACEQIKGKALVSLFNTGSKKWRGFLVARGKENGGTKACIDYCLNPPAAGTKTRMNDDNWYVPFSMGKSDVRSRVKPKPGAKLKRLGLLIESIV
jgi:hypothetical protein